VKITYKLAGAVCALAMLALVVAYYVTGRNLDAVSPYMSLVGLIWVGISFLERRSGRAKRP
jgi:hypothetical protein